jgi:NAD(P)H-quinone oxidoreductase subunit 6
MYLYTTLVKRLSSIFIMTILILSDPTKSIILLFIELGILIGSLGIVLFRQIIYSALLLGFVFICVALMYLLLNADFLAAAQVLIYIGAINVLIVFAIMLVNKPDLEHNNNVTFGEIISALMSIALFGLLTNIIFDTSWQSLNSSSVSILPNQILTESSVASVYIIGVHLLTDFLLPFELLSIVLLLALIGAIVIARKESTI